MLGVRPDAATWLAGATAGAEAAADAEAGAPALAAGLLTGLPQPAQNAALSTTTAPQCAQKAIRIPLKRLGIDC